MARKTDAAPAPAEGSVTLMRVARDTIRFVLSELKPKGKMLTPFNVITGAIMLVGVVLIVIRFAFGLSSVTNLSQNYPWGIWIGFDVVTGVAFAGGAYVLTFLVHILKVKKYEPIVRVTVLNGFLAYVFYAGALLLDLGRPWNVINPIIGNSFGLSSVLFLVAWHFMLYMICEFLEFSPAVAEWLHWPKARRILEGLTTGAVIFGITLSTLHQSGLGALFLLAPSKIHPLWYSHNIPVMFFVSSIFAGISMVIIESTFTHRVFKDRIGHELHEGHNSILLGLGKGAVGALFAYIFIKMIDFVHYKLWEHINTPMGYWYMFELVGFVVLPIALFLTAIRRKSVKLVQYTAFLTGLGVILNRLNVSVIAFKWYEAVRYYPSWMEIEVTLAIISMELWVFRWVINRMPVFGAHPAAAAVEEETAEDKEVVRWKASAL
ncbi:MAG TPA: NrfD/PsrC family molybdoenzyme membrane anchor subunit [Candidatus Deferrimicrobiaceae bacterium]|jgi:Ni/Fe-hydrogenase subunit HybB-like protein